MKRFFRSVVICLPAFLAMYLISCGRVPSQRERDMAVYPGGLSGVPRVRVLISQNLPDVQLSVDGPYSISAQPADPQSPQIGSGDKPVTVRVSPLAKGLKLGAAEVTYSAVTVSPVGSTRLTVADTPFDGPVTFIRSVRDVNGKPVLGVNLVVSMNIEEYLAGVVPSEMPANWPTQALKAQCVAARTYALYKIQTRADQLFDVTSTQASQVWKPQNRHNAAINAVVNETRGVVMTDNYRLFPAYFSRQCGGITKNGAGVFISRHINPLSEVKCPYCQGKPGAEQWEYRVSLDSLAQKLKTNGYKDMGTISSITGLDENGRAVDGIERVYDVQVQHSGPSRTALIPAMNFRRIIGGGQKEMASTFFSTATEGGMVVFRGRGHGHGVGMCQYGAAQLAGDGKTYQEILRWYYPQCLLVRIWEGAALK